MTQLIKQSWTSYPNIFFYKLKYEENMYKCYYCGIKESTCRVLLNIVNCHTEKKH